MRRTYQLITKIQLMLFATVGLLLTFTACSSDDLEDAASSKELFDVNLSISTRVTADDPESQIKSLKVFAFDGERLVSRYEKANITGIEHSFTMQLPEEFITFYVIANENAAGELKKENAETFNFSTANKKTDLEAITFSSLPGDVANKGIPMTAIYTTPAKVDRKTPIVIDNLKRSIAKLNIYVVKKGSESAHAYMNRGIYLYNEPKYGYLFAEKSLYKDPVYNHRESEAGTQTDGNNQKGGKVVFSAEWKNEKIPTEAELSKSKNEIKKLHSPGMTQDANNFEFIQSTYLFANPNGERITEEKANAYYIKVGWTRQYSDQGTMIIDTPQTASIYLPTVNANDNLNFFAYISVTSTAINKFNWFVSPWAEGGGNIDFQ